MTSTLRFVQLSDLHQFADPHKRLLNVSPYDCFQAVLQCLKAETSQPDFILLTGDLAQDCEPKTYQRIATELGQLSIPTYFIPGNHDLSFEQMKQHLNHSMICADHMIDKKNWRLILLDSKKINQPYGELNQQQLQFLRDSLQSAGQKFCLIALHHHSIKANAAWLDQSDLKNAEQFWQIISNYSNVKAVICGHIHQDFHQLYKGIHVLSAPSTWIQFTPNTDVFTLDSHNKPGYRWYELYHDGRLKSEVVRVTECDYRPDDKATGY